MTNEKILKATHSGTITIADTELPCYVLEDGSRVLTQTGAVQAIGMGQFAQLPKFMGHDRLKPFVSAHLSNLLENRITFKKAGGGKLSHGYDATILVEICDAVFEANKNGALHRKQLHIAEKCEMLTRSFAKIGIIALIDEATGYQDVRKQDALQKILDAFISKELAAWVKRFPDDFYNEMFRLKGWNWNSLKRPAVVGTYTNDIVYERLAPNLVEELKKKTPKSDKGHRANKYHQWLTTDVGHPILSQHLYAVIGLMRTCQTWEQFKRLINRAFPKKNEQMLLELGDE